ncbi:MAG TPA: hypothetical protein VLT36_13720 [Candidatus Dormibacteraeota bacterium]|nr:hypothetical protein [Candidatus Dormibacteraeota bacterium]
MNKALEDLQADRGDNEPPNQAETEPVYANRAANWSIALPIVAVFISEAVVLSNRDASPDMVLLMDQFAIILTAFLILGGVTLAIIALCSRKGQGDRPVVRPVLGMIANLLLIALIGTGFVHGFQKGLKNRVLARTVTQTSEDLQAEMKKTAEEGRGFTTEQAQDNLSRMSGALDGVSQNGTGATALLAKASKAYLDQIQPLTTNYSVALKNVLQPPLLDMSGIERRDQLAAKKQLVRAFLLANEKLEAFATNRMNLYREQLRRFSVPSEVIEQAMAVRKSTILEEDALARKIREDDRRMGKAMLGMLDVLDVNFGKWTYNLERKKVVFDNDALLDKYISFRDEMQSAAKEQQRLQAKLLELASR